MASHFSILTWRIPWTDPLTLTRTSTGLVLPLAGRAGAQSAAGGKAHFPACSRHSELPVQ